MKFERKNFTYHGGYLHYNVGSESRFVARFKWGGMGDFKTFLIKNFSVGEYFSLLDSGVAPCTILEAKGWVHPNLKKAEARFDVAKRIASTQKWALARINIARTMK